MVRTPIISKRKIAAIQAALLTIQINSFQLSNRINLIKSKNASTHICNDERTIWSGTCSYIEAVKWSDFIANYNKYVDFAIDRQNHIDEYKLCKEV